MRQRRQCYEAEEAVPPRIFWERKETLMNLQIFFLIQQLAGRVGVAFSQNEHQFALFSSASGGRRLHRRCLNLAVRYEAAIGG